jgi:predicted RNA-binding protein with PIN domain
VSVHWLVDGMNVIGSRPDGWWRDRRGAQRRLAADLARFAADRGEAVTVVFDGRPWADAPGEALLDVRFATRGGPDAADDDIARIVREEPHPGLLRVVTSDRALAERARTAGAEVVGAGSLLRDLGR